MFDRSQLMRGTLEGCILQIIRQRATYGYEITLLLQKLGFDEIKEGTLYPLLIRLERRGLIASAFRPSPLGPSRKYYHLTGEGQRYLEEFICCWRQISAAVNGVLGEEG